MDPESLAIGIGSVGRWLTYGGAIVLIGSAGAQMVVRRAWRSAGVSDTRSIERDVLRVGLYASIVLVVMAAGRLYAHTYSVFGIEEQVTWEYVRLIATKTGWGRGWQAQVVAAVAAVIVLLGAPYSTRLRMWGPGLVGLGVAGTLPLTGHAVAEVTPWIGVTLQCIHVTAVGLWIGTLIVTLIVTRSTRGDTNAEGMFTRAIQMFSPLAVGAVSALAVTGLITAWIYLDTFSSLWSIGYGRVLSAKVLLFGATGAIGAYNWKRLKLALGTPGSSVALRRNARVELILASVVLAVTAVLVVLPHTSM